MVHVAARLEGELGLDDGALRFEIQVETPQSILGPDGTALVARMVHASRRPLHRPALRHLRLLGVLRHRRGAPDLEHPVADHAKAVMQAAAAGTGVRLSDGSTNVLPVGDADEVARRLGATTTGWSAARSSAATTRAGTCTRPSCRRGTPRRSRSTATGSPPRPTGCATYVEHGRDSGVARRAGHRPRAGRLPAPRARLRRAVDETEVPRRPGSTRRPRRARAPRHDDRGG